MAPRGNGGWGTHGRPWKASVKSTYTVCTSYGCNGWVFNSRLGTGKLVLCDHCEEPYGSAPQPCPAPPVVGGRRRTVIDEKKASSTTPALPDDVKQMLIEAVAADGDTPLKTLSKRILNLHGESVQTDASAVVEESHSKQLDKATRALRAAEDEAEQAARAVANLHAKLKAAEEKLRSASATVQRCKQHCSALFAVQESKPVPPSASDEEADILLKDVTAKLQQSAEDIGCSQEDYDKCKLQHAAIVAAQEQEVKARATVQAAKETRAAKTKELEEMLPELFISGKRRKVETASTGASGVLGAPAATLQEGASIEEHAKHLLEQAAREAAAAAAAGAQPVSAAPRTEAAPDAEMRG